MMVVSDPSYHIYMEGKGVLCNHVFTLRTGALAKLYRMLNEHLRGHVSWVGRFKSHPDSMNLTLVFKKL